MAFQIVKYVESKMKEEFESFVFNECVPTMKEECPADTGALRASIHAEKVSDKEFIVGTDKRYAPAVNFGRKEVFPVVKQALYWAGIEGGRPVRHAKEYKGNNFLQRTVDRLNGG